MLLNLGTLSAHGEHKFVQQEDYRKVWKSAPYDNVLLYSPDTLPHIEDTTALDLQ